MISLKTGISIKVRLLARLIGILLKIEQQLLKSGLHA